MQKGRVGIGRAEVGKAAAAAAAWWRLTAGHAIAWLQCLRGGRQY